MRNLLTLVALAGAMSSAWGQSGIGLIQPDAGFVIGIELRKVLDSAAGATLRQQIGASEVGRFPGFQGMAETLLRDIDSVVIAAPASALQNASSSQTPALLVVKGRFDPETIRKAAGAGKAGENYRSVELLATSTGSPGGRASVIGMLDAGTLLAGDRAQVRAAIDRAQTGRITRPAGVLAGINELAASNHVWMIVAPPPGVPMKEAPPMVQQMFADLVSLEMGMSFTSGLAMRVNIREKNEPAALNMAQSLQGLLSMAMMSDADPEKQAVLKKIQIAPEGAVVRIALNLDNDELQKIMQQAQSARASGSAGAPAAPPVRRGSGPAIKPPDPPKSGTVRITGLDGGPVEVPLAQPPKR